ncbi:MAG: hypothetical protein JKX97_07555 [Candidatus Lindowbacteria bacterium]|nr:hypothetical protein [Candidatus Lindowbacteria bacterium]
MNDIDKANQKEWENEDNWSTIGSLKVIYFSKKDSRLCVPKSIVSHGWTFNLGHRHGTIFLYFLLFFMFCVGGLVFGPLGFVVGGW